MTLDGNAIGLLERIRGARQGGYGLDGEGADVDVATAYRIQAALGEERRLKGYKVTALRPRAGAGAGTPALLHGRVYADMLLAGRVSLGRFLRPRLACRLAAVLGEDVPPASPPGHVHRAVAARLLALEITDSVWADGEPSLAGAVADNAGAGAVVVGERLLEPPLEGTVELRLQGRPLLEHPLADFEDGEERIAWLADQVGGLRQGQLVCLAPCTGDEVVEAAPGALSLCGPDGSVLAVEITT